jgi:16S rRNA (cytidine1402-2'-O)-methyltransferase
MGTLYIVSTPIGNLEDITIRALRILFSTSVILCEDTRRTGLLLQELETRYHQILTNFVLQNTYKNERQLIRFDDHTEIQKLPEIIQLLLSGTNIALVTDAGTPLISDPGYVVVTECQKRNIKVIPIPGPSAFVTALSASGLPTDTICFFGYPPEKQGKRIQKFTAIKQMATIHSFTAIFYCAPHKLQNVMDDIHEVFGEQTVIIARELTKVHEEIVSIIINQNLSVDLSEIKGEIVLLLHLSNK